MRAFSSDSIFNSGSIASTSMDSSLILGGWYTEVIESVGILAALGGGGGRIGPLHISMLYSEGLKGSLTFCRLNAVKWYCSHRF